MSSPLVDQIVKQTECLPDELQQRVLECATALTCAAPAGVPGERLVRFAASIPLDDVKRIREAIEQGCEHVDANEW